MEYSRHGTVIKGQEKAVARSKYEEDVTINNHTVSNQEQETLLKIGLHFIFLNKGSTAQN